MIKTIFMLLYDHNCPLFVMNLLVKELSTILHISLPVLVLQLGPQVT